MAGRVSREKRYAIRAGLFVGGGLVLASVVILLIGKERRAFDRQRTYHGAFENVDGLSLDSPVRLGGLDVGHVTAITFSPDLGDKRIQVQMEISQRFAERIRADSVARVASRGVLGDKAIDVSLGSPAASVVPNGGEIPTGSSGDISSLLKASGEIVDNAISITRDLRQGVASYTDPDLRKDIVGLAKSAKEILGEVQSGHGVLHDLIYDRKTTEDFKAVMASVSESASRLDAAVGQAEQVLRDVRQGDGTAHALIYDKKGALALDELGTAANELATVIHDAKTSPNGAVHQLVYGDARGIFADLGQAAADVRAMTTKIRHGDGSLGGIINDPTVYEDLRTVLGNVKRNRVLRTLVRYSIENGEESGTAPKPPEHPKKAEQ
jgi:phospholipid/cholesterol/gamma-HCH transport system substrate-binding protein